MEPVRKIPPWYKVLGPGLTAGSVYKDRCSSHRVELEQSGCRSSLLSLSISSHVGLFFLFLVTARIALSAVLVGTCRPTIGDAKSTPPYASFPDTSRPELSRASLASREPATLIPKVKNLNDREIVR
jgi:hypothetical protein